MEKRDFVITVLIIILVALLFVVFVYAYDLDRRGGEKLCLFVADRPDNIATTTRGNKCFAKTTEGYWIRVYGVEINDDSD